MPGRTIARLACFAASSIIAVCSAQPVLAATYVTPAVWTNYVSAQGQPTAWGDVVRGLASGGNQTPLSASTATSAQIQHVQQGGNALDLIVPIGWVDSGRDPSTVSGLIQGFDAHGSASAEQDLANQVTALQTQYTGGVLYWQLANEINSSVMTQNLLAAKGIAVGSDDHDDTRSIPVYAEYIFAPSVEAIQQASARLYGNKKKINIVLGTIANARGKAAQAWLDQLLNYRIKGTFAPSLTNTRVADNFSIIALNYTATSDDTGSGGHWDGIMNTLDQKWRLPGIVKGVWATEELGQQRADAGLGMATSVRVSAQYLSRAAHLQLSPVQIRCSLYGWNLGLSGVSGGTGMQTLFSLFGRGKLTDLSDGISVAASQAMKAFSFSSANGRRLTVVFNAPSTSKPGTVSSVTVSSSGSSGSLPTAAVLTASGSVAVAVSAAYSGSKTTYILGTPVQLLTDQTLVIQQ
jgi:hypothetical protein